MPKLILDDRALVAVSGPDAEHLLQNVITTDLDKLAPGEAKPGALLTPQGKIMFDFLVSRNGPDSLRIDLDAALADDFARRMMLYRLRAKAEIAKQDQMVVVASWQADSGSSRFDSSCSQTDSTLADLRFPPAAGVRRAYLSEPPAADASLAEWTALRVRHGVAESGADFAAGDAFPHDVLLDQNGGVGFRKGCFVGQEVVSRMQHRGTARRRVLVVTGAAALPAPGTEVKAGGRTVGALGSVAGADGIAIVRIDKVREAMDAGTPIEADGVALTFAIPAWAGFTWPDASAATPGDA
jgi:folate-binding protein YgfZ